MCVDAAYYKFPDQRYLEGMVSQVPADFLFGFKVTDEITIRKFTNLPRFEEFAAVFEEAVRLRMRADVPVGCYSC